MSSTATETIWQQQLADQVAAVGAPDDTTHLIVNVVDGDYKLLALASSRTEADVTADEQATQVAGGEIAIVAFNDIRPLLDTDTADETDDDETADLAHAPTGADEDAIVVDGTASGPDADKGQLFDVPRATIIVDESDPTLIKLAFSGSVELDRTKPDDVRVYNAFRAGQHVEFNVEGYVAGAGKTKRRDKEGNIQAIVETKSIVVESLTDTDEL